MRALIKASSVLWSCFFLHPGTTTGVAALTIAVQHRHGRQHTGRSEGSSRSPDPSRGDGDGDEDGDGDGDGNEPGAGRQAEDQVVETNERARQAPEEELEECPVCLDAKVDPGQAAWQGCAHKVCQECLKKHRKAAGERDTVACCPICRAPPRIDEETQLFARFLMQHFAEGGAGDRGEAIPGIFGASQRDIMALHALFRRQREAGEREERDGAAGPSTPPVPVPVPAALEPDASAAGGGDEEDEEAPAAPSQAETGTAPRETE